MAAHVTHEVRNPLTSIGLNVELLEEELRDAGPEATDILRAIHREIEHLTALTEEYLRVARLPNPQLEPEDLADIARDTVAFLRPELEAAGVQLELDAPPGLPLAALDEAQIRQVLINLLKNARDAMPRGGRVRVQVSPHEGGIAVRIADQGTGMTPEQRQRIFELFFTTKAGGTGLGLPLSQQIVVAHGGVIRCDSAPDQGSVFEVWFPVYEGDGKRAEADSRMRPDGGEPLAHSGEAAP
jgi:signal transduction histidine kinase